MLMHWRAGKCRKCGIKSGLGDCEDCRALRQAMQRLAEAAIAQFAPEYDCGYSTEPDEEE